MNIWIIALIGGIMALKQQIERLKKAKESLIVAKKQSDFKSKDIETDYIARAKEKFLEDNEKNILNLAANMIQEELEEAKQVIK